MSAKRLLLAEKVAQNYLLTVKHAIKINMGAHSNFKTNLENFTDLSHDFQGSSANGKIAH